jgi:hypothetical protein
MMIILPIRGIRKAICNLVNVGPIGLSDLEEIIAAMTKATTNAPKMHETANLI